MALSSDAQRAFTKVLQLLPLQSQEAIIAALDIAITSVSSLLVPATTAQFGVVKQGAAVANGAVPFADLTAASNKVNELLASLRTAGVIAP